MHLDIATLTVVSAFVALMSGVLLLVARVQYHDTGRAVGWWAAGHFAAAAGLVAVIVAGTPAQGVAGVVAFAMFALAPALVWTGARRFSERPASYVLVFSMPVLVVVASYALPFPPYIVGGLTTAVISFLFFLAAAWTLAFEAREPLLSRWPLAFLCVFHAIAIALTGLIDIPADAMPSWMDLLFETVHFESLIYLLGTAIFAVAWTRESNEQFHKRAADTDVLTGLANRRAFLDTAERTLERCQFTETPCAVAVFDLDHFKTVNDTYGHETGDKVLRLFAEVARKALRPGDMIGRLGGEEFAAIAGGASIEAAIALAERVRRSYAEAAQTVEGMAINGTVSAGVSANVSGDDLGSILRRADAALYAAKLRGRNRVEAAVEGKPASPSNVVRVA